MYHRGGYGHFNLVRTIFFSYALRLELETVFETKHAARTDMIIPVSSLVQLI